MKSTAPHKVDRFTVTLVPTSEERSLRNVPSTFSPVNRTYHWKRSEHFEYMVVPRRITNKEVTVDLFVDLPKKAKQDLQAVLRTFVSTKMRSEWQGFRLGGISRGADAEPPRQTFKRATIEEILGVRLEP